MSTRSVAPGFLIAMPQLEDPNFDRSVVLMVEHGASGSFGLIVNRPTEIKLASVVETLGISWSGDADAVVWSGGPVQTRTGWLLHEPSDVEGAALATEVASGILLSSSPDHLRAIAAAPPERLRFFLGYSGWGAGQLESELASGAWLLAPASAELLFEVDAADLWDAAIRSLGIEPASLVPAHGVH